MGLELAIRLPRSPELLSYRHAPLHLAGDCLSELKENIGVMSGASYSPQFQILLACSKHSLPSFLQAMGGNGFPNDFQTASLLLTGFP